MYSFENNEYDIALMVRVEEYTKELGRITLYG